jgi:hypothetical protein
MQSHIKLHRHCHPTQLHPPLLYTHSNTSTAHFWDGGKE